MKKPFLLCSGKGFRRYFRQEAKVFFSVSMLMDLAMRAFMPASRSVLHVPDKGVGGHGDGGDGYGRCLNKERI